MDLRELLELMAGVERMCDVARQHNDVPLLDQAIKQARQVASQLVPGHAHYPGVNMELARCLALRYRLTGDQQSLAESIKTLRITVSAAAPSDPIRVAFLNNLGNALADWHQLTGDIAALQDAGESFRAAIALLSQDDPRRATIVSALSDVVYERYRADGRQTLLDEALALARSAMRLMPPSQPGHAIAANNLANVLLERYQTTAQPEALAEVVSVLRPALATVALDPTDRALALGTLGTALLLTHEATGDLTPLTEAERALTEALTLSAPGEALRPGHLNTLGNAYSDRHRASGDLAALEHATALYRQAIEAVRPSHRSYPDFVSNLANTLSQRYELLGDLPALDEAVTLLHQARDQATTAGRGFIDGTLGGVLLRKYQRQRDKVLLQQAIYAFESALVAAAPGDTRRPVILNNLGNALQEDYKLTGETTRLKDAERRYREAASAASLGDPVKVMALSNLGNLLLDAWRKSAAASVLADAVDASRQAAALTEKGHGTRGQILANLGVAARELHEVTGSPSLAAEARSAFAEAAQLPSAAPGTRVGAARAWGELARSTGSPDALRAYQTAVSVLPQVAPRQLGRSDQEFGLARFVGLGADAAAAALDHNDPAEALRLVESARGILISHSIEQQAGLTLLDQRMPQLAQQFRDLVRQLNTPKPTASLIPANPAGHGANRFQATHAPLTANRSSLQQRWARLVQDIREVPGLEEFLQPPNASQLISDAGEGPVVVLNTSRHRSDALVVQRGQVRSVPLPDLTPESVAEQVLACATVLAGALDRSASISERGAAEVALSDILAWLWNAVVKPVIDHLAAGPASSSRIWWVPTGLLSFLPIHAAGRHHTHSGPPSTLLDCAISSYAPTLRSLGHARRRPVSPSARTLIVGMPETPGWSPLPFANAECETVADLTGTALVLAGEHATRQRLLRELPQHQMFHFAGHAHGDLSAPSEGSLLLHDHARAPFTVSDVVRLNLTGAEVAFLSGCDTALSGIQLADEAINLASAFHLAGFRHVVASLWAIDDELASQVAAPVWHSVSGRHGTRNTAAATSEGIRTLRDRWRRCPSRWAGYLHVGP